MNEEEKTTQEVVQPTEPQETQPVQETEKAPEMNGGKYTYYLSTPEVPFKVVYMDEPFAPGQVPFRMHTEKPNDDMIYPVWSYKENKWVDQSEKTIPEKIQKLDDKFQTLDDSQKLQKQETDQNKKTLDEITKFNQDTNQAIQEIKENSAATTQLLMEFFAAMTPGKDDTTEEGENNEQ